MAREATAVPACRQAISGSIRERGEEGSVEDIAGADRVDDLDNGCRHRDQQAVRPDRESAVRDRA